MADQSSQELIPIEQDFGENLGKLMEKIGPTLAELGRNHWEGFQVIIAAPVSRISSEEVYREVMGRDIDSVGAQILGLGEELSARPVLGFLNVTRDGSGAVTLDYRSKTGGTNFMVTAGEKIEVSGATPKEVYGALSMLFDEQGEFVKDVNRINMMGIKNLEFFDKDGNLLAQEESRREKAKPVLLPFE